MENITKIQETLITIFTSHVRLPASFEAKKALPSLNPTEFHNPHSNIDSSSFVYMIYAWETKWQTTYV
jgi:hypothetical protein